LIITLAQVVRYTRSFSSRKTSTGRLEVSTNEVQSWNGFPISSSGIPSLTYGSIRRRNQVGWELGSENKKDNLSTVPVYEPYGLRIIT
jgi:hypothetical protein